MEAAEKPKPASEQTPSTWTKGCTSTTPIEDRSKHPLSGCCFMVRGSNGQSLRQGVVRAIVSSNSPKGDLALVQYFDALMGERNTLSLIPLAEMDPEKGGWGGWVFFEDNMQLREYYEMHQHRRDELVAKREGKAVG